MMEAFCLAALMVVSSAVGVTGTGTAASAEPGDGAGTAALVEAEETETIHFVDVFRQHYEAPLQENVPCNPYHYMNFGRVGEQLYYEDDQYTSRLGIDVSKYQDSVDWEAVREAGYEFVFIRIGFRGYGKAGNLVPDKKFEDHYQGATAAGLDVGVYFFSQAIDEDEAKEEADFVLEVLQNRPLQLPIVYDPESILDDVARTDDVTGEQFTQNTIVFCEAIESAGYQSMIYSNMLWEAFQFDLSRLSDRPVWYADYEPFPQTPYDFVFWQYTNTGRVPGISGDMDINIQMIKK